MLQKSATIDLSKALDLITNLVETSQKHRAESQRRYSLNRYGNSLNFHLINVAFTRTHREK